MKGIEYLPEIILHLLKIHTPSGTPKNYTIKYSYGVCR